MAEKTTNAFNLFETNFKNHSENYSEGESKRKTIHDFNKLQIQ